MINYIAILVFALAAFAGFAIQLVFWIEMEPTLRNLGYKIDVLSLKKYPNGMKTLWEYKKHCIAERKTLKWWWTYWSMTWILVLTMILWLVLLPTINRSSDSWSKPESVEAR